MFSVYGAQEIASVFAVYLFAAMAKGVTGLGFSTTCLPFLKISLGSKETLALLIIPSLASNVIVMTEASAFRASIVRFWGMFLLGERVRKRLPPAQFRLAVLGMLAALGGALIVRAF